MINQWVVTKKERGSVRGSRRSSREDTGISYEGYCMVNQVGQRCLW